MSFLITMSQKELHRLEVIQKIHDQRLSVVQAASVLGISRSQMHRVLKAYETDGMPGLISKKRQQQSNRRHSENLRNAVLDLVRERYADFGPTLACEKLIERHQLAIGKETLRQWRTNDWTICCHWSLRCKKAAIYSGANVVRAEPDRPTVCLRSRTAARAMDIKSAVASLGDGRIS